MELWPLKFNHTITDLSLKGLAWLIGRVGVFFRKLYVQTIMCDVAIDIAILSMHDRDVGDKINNPINKEKLNSVAISMQYPYDRHTSSILSILYLSF